MIYEGRRSSRSNCASFFERGSRRAENVSSNETRVIHSPLIARLVFQTVPHPTYPSKFIMGMHESLPYSSFPICQLIIGQGINKGGRWIVRSIETWRSERCCRSSTTSREEATMRSNAYRVPSSLTRIPSAW